MPGLTLGIGETNPKKGAVQFDARRVDGVQFVIPTAAGITAAPIGSIVTLQESAVTGLQKIVLGAFAWTDGSGNEYSIIGLGFLEAANQSNTDIDQTVGSYKTGDIAAMISDLNVVAAVPMLTGANPVAGPTSYITPAGELASTASGDVAFPGTVFFRTAGPQASGQLKTGYCYARLLQTNIGAA